MHFERASENEKDFAIRQSAIQYNRDNKKPHKLRSFVQFDDASYSISLSCPSIVSSHTLCFYYVRHFEKTSVNKNCNIIFLIIISLDISRNFY